MENLGVCGPSRGVMHEECLSSRHHLGQQGSSRDDHMSGERPERKRRPGVVFDATAWTAFLSGPLVRPVGGAILSRNARNYYFRTLATSRKEPTLATTAAT